MRGVACVVAVVLSACGAESQGHYEPRPFTTASSAQACSSNAQCAAGEACFVYESPTSEQSLCAASAAPCDLVTCTEETAGCIQLPNAGHVVCLTVMETLHGT